MAGAYLVEPRMKTRKLLRSRAVQAKTGYDSRVTLWRKSRDPDDDFPRAVQLTPKGPLAWYEDEIDAWLASRPRVDFATPANPTAPTPQPEAA